MEASLFNELSLLVTGCAVMAWMSTRVKQPVLIAYLFCGMLVGPPGFNWVSEVHLLESLSGIGITLLLFLAGMVLHPNRLSAMFRSTLFITLASSAAFWLVFYLCLVVSPLTHREAMIGAACLVFSSTILVVKLLPTTTLHQRHMGSLCIAILIAQDFLAVIMLVLVSGNGGDSFLLQGMLLFVKTLLLIAAAIAGEQFILRWMMRQSDRFHEVLYVLCVGWCLWNAWLASTIGLSPEIGAFLGGLSLARSPLSRFLTEQLKPLRDFFLMLFFFALGASLQPQIIRASWPFILLVSGLGILVKPLVYTYLFKRSGESLPFSKEMGIRLIPDSEFGLILSTAAVHAGAMSIPSGQIIQSAIILNMIFSCWIIVRLAPTPLAASPELKQD